jgi:hypothetical protein
MSRRTMSGSHFQKESVRGKARWSRPEGLVDVPAGFSANVTIGFEDPDDRDVQLTTTASAAMVKTAMAPASSTFLSRDTLPRGTHDHR